METTKEEIGRRIKQAIDQSKISQRSLSKHLRVVESTVTAYIQGNSLPSAVGLAQIAKLCNVTLDWLITGVEPVPKKPATVTYLLNEKEQKAVIAAEDLLGHYGLDKRFRVTEVHHPPQVNNPPPDIQEMIDIMTSLDPEYRADLLKAAREKKIIYELALKKEVVKAIEAEKLKELKEADNILADLAGGEPIAGEPKDRQPAEQCQPRKDSTGSPETLLKS